MGQTLGKHQPDHRLIQRAAGLMTFGLKAAESYWVRYKQSSLVHTLTGLRRSAARLSAAVMAGQRKTPALLRSQVNAGVRGEADHEPHYVVRFEGKPLFPASALPSRDRKTSTRQRYHSYFPFHSDGGNTARGAPGERMLLVRLPRSRPSNRCAIVFRGTFLFSPRDRTFAVDCGGRDV